MKKVEFFGAQNTSFWRPWHPNAIWCDMNFYANYFLSTLRISYVEMVYISVVAKQPLTECLPNRSDEFFFSKVLKRKMRNVLKRPKNQISDFSDFCFSSYGHFCIQNLVNFRWLEQKEKLFFSVFHSFLNYMGGGTADR